MKRVILFTILAMALLAPGISKAQLDVIPNHNFESWTTTAGKLTPTSWNLLSGSADSFSAVNYTDSFGLITVPTFAGKECIGLACGGTGSNPTPGVIYIKFAMKSLDPFLIMRYAYIQGGNAPNGWAFLMKVWHHGPTGLATDTALNGGIKLTATSVKLDPWQTFSFNLASSYTSTTVPDSAIIEIYNQSQLPFDPGTELYIEDLYFSNSAATPGGISSQIVAKNSVTAYPNPFTNTTTIQYNLGINSNVNLSVFDIQGREVSTLVNSNQVAGSHEVTFDGEGLKSGIYFYRLQTDNGVQTGKLVLNN